MKLHARTFRKAREQVRLMIADGFSATQIRNYLLKWSQWWVEISREWRLQNILQSFFEYSWNLQVSAVALAILPKGIIADSRRCAAPQIHIGQQAHF
jgi:hypothetical protein